MAEFGINIDTIYQTVQALANKEQRGYLTPQEFNLFANQAQLDIFEQYFYDLGAFAKANQAAGIGENHEVGDSVQMVRHKLTPWTDKKAMINQGGGIYVLGASYWRSGRLFGPNNNELRKMSKDEYQNISNSKWHTQGASEIIYHEDGYSAPDGLRIIVKKDGGAYSGVIYNEQVGGRPKLVYWGYVIVNEKPTYDPAQSSHFEIHASEQPDLVIKILKLAGVSIEDGSLVQFGGAEDQQNIQQENK